MVDLVDWLKGTRLTAQRMAAKTSTFILSPFTFSFSLSDLLTLSISFFYKFPASQPLTFLSSNSSFVPRPSSFHPPSTSRPPSVDHLPSSSRPSSIPHRTTLQSCDHLIFTTSHFLSLPPSNLHNASRQDAKSPRLFLKIVYGPGDVVLH